MDADGGLRVKDHLQGIHTGDEADVSGSTQSARESLQT